MPHFGQVRACILIPNENLIKITPVSSKTDVKTDQDTWIISKLDYHSITTMQLPSDIEVFSDKDYKP